MRRFLDGAVNRRFAGYVRRIAGRTVGKPADRYRAGIAAVRRDRRGRNESPCLGALSGCDFMGSGSVAALQNIRFDHGRLHDAGMGIAQEQTNDIPQDETGESDRHSKRSLESERWRNRIRRRIRNGRDASPQTEDAVFRNRRIALCVKYREPVQNPTAQFPNKLDRASNTENQP